MAKDARGSERIFTIIPTIRRIRTVLLGVLLYTNAHADSVYLTELLTRAESVGLAARREWQTLLHYRPSAHGEGVISDADDPRFFLAPTGQTDPSAELAATLRAFFTHEPAGADPQPAQCAFIARYRWLKAELNIDDRRLPPQPCERFQHWFHELNTETATLIFASAYLNNPASLFGHTLLRLDQRGQTEHTRLLAYTINYAADDSDSNLLMYAVDGVAGGFKGRFDVQPYYQQVRVYSDLESRDLWEYRLNLRPAQLQRLLEHVWELRGIEFDYYFFRENCAWQLLTLLEVADPDLRLSDAFTVWTLPADTIRQLVQQPGLVGDIIARPARGTAIQRRYATLTSNERRLARRLWQSPNVAADPEFTQMAPARQALLLELALDQRQHQYAGRQEPGDKSPPDAGTYQLLSARQKLPVSAPPVVIEPFATRPETGHASRRLGVGLGQRDGAAFVEFNARASYHDLLEPDAGYTPDAQIELLSLALRHYPQRGGLELDRLTLLDITSLPPFNTLTPRPAWRIHAGWMPLPREDNLDGLGFNLSGGLGLVAETVWPWRTLWFGLPGLELDYHRDLANDYRVNLGMTAGLLLQPTTYWKVLTSVTWLDDPFGGQDAGLRAIITQNLVLEPDLSFSMDWRYWAGVTEFSLGLRAYF